MEGITSGYAVDDIWNMERNYLIKDLEEEEVYLKMGKQVSSV